MEQQEQIAHYVLLHGTAQGLRRFCKLGAGDDFAVEVVENNVQVIVGRWGHP